MHPDEARALRRAALILMSVSAARWAWLARPAATAEPQDSVLPALTEGTLQATEEGARRREPLRDGERIDPNRADEIDLDRLPGVGPATALAIIAARDSGVVFRRPEDVLVVRGIGRATLDRMLPSLAFPDPPPGRGAVPGPPPPVDLNRADQQALEALPGIGPALAARILGARKERVFTSLEDLERVPGVGPATIERLRPHATVGGAR